MHFILPATVVCFALAINVILGIYRGLNSPLRNVPGPFLTRFTRLWYLYTVYNGQAHHMNIQLHRKYAKQGDFYAPVVRIGPNMYSVSQPIKAMYGTGSKMEKSSWYDGFRHPNPERYTTFTDRNIKRHAETRRKFNSIYSLSNLLHFESFVDEAQVLLQRHFTKMTETGEKIDLYNWLRYYAFDVIGSITFGSRFGFLDEGKDIEDSMRSLDRSLVYATLVGIYAWVHPMLYWIMEKLPSSGAGGRTFIMSIARRKVTEREALRKERSQMKEALAAQNPVARDFLDIALDAAEDPEKKMTSDNVFMLAYSNIVAGSDTTAMALSSVLWHLTQSPRAMTKLRAELDGAIEQGRMTNESISFTQSQTLPYLQACVKEGLRMCAATGLPLWRVVPPGGAYMLGHFFPEGTEVGLNTWVAHYNRDVWGTDVDEFRPERWLPTSEDQKNMLEEMEKYFLPFGQGSRICIGKHISYLEIYKVVPLIVSKFDITFVRPTPVLQTVNYWFLKPTEFSVYIKKRGQK